MRLGIDRHHPCGQRAIFYVPAYILCKPWLAIKSTALCYIHAKRYIKLVSSETKRPARPTACKNVLTHTKSW